MSLTNLEFSLHDNVGNDLYFVTDAVIEESQDLKVITFIEQTDLELKTKVLIYKDRVELIRMGLISMYVEFTLNNPTQMIIKTSYGHEIKMENKTLQLEIKSNSIYVVYQTITDKEKGITHTLNIKW